MSGARCESRDQQGVRHRPCCLRRGGALHASLRVARKGRGDGAPGGAPVLQLSRAALRQRGRLPALRRDVYAAPGRASRAVRIETNRVSAGSRQRLLVASGGAPAPPGAGLRGRTRAPHLTSRLRHQPKQDRLARARQPRLGDPTQAGATGFCVPHAGSAARTIIQIRQGGDKFFLCDRRPDWQRRSAGLNPPSNGMSPLF
ncbi:hypothetical protein DFP91_1088 [Pseudorhodoplanes sinuspersici]|nr:hypothetical protein DFP91_1088 [Pseudorhodoplanes sinuspersici]